MNVFDDKRLYKMYEKIDSIARNGKLGFDDYKEYIDEIADSGQFWILQNMLSRKYGIKNTGKVSIVDVKTYKFYDVIRLQTNSDFQKDLKKLYDDNSCYQIGKKVYSATHSLLGEIYQESSISSNQTLLDDFVISVKGTEIRAWGSTYSLIDRYKEGINFILS